MPMHVEMPPRWQEHARRRSTEVTQAVEQARLLHEQAAPDAPRDQLAHRRLARRAAEEAARARMTFPPPPPPTAAA